MLLKSGRYDNNIIQIDLTFLHNTNFSILFFKYLWKVFRASDKSKLIRLKAKQHFLEIKTLLATFSYLIVV